MKNKSNLKYLVKVASYGLLVATLSYSCYEPVSTDFEKSGYLKNPKIEIAESKLENKVNVF